MDTIDAGVSAVALYHDKTGELDYVDVGAEAAKMLYENEDLDENGFGIHFSSGDSHDSMVAELNGRIQELNGGANFQTDGKATSEVRNLQEACSTHTARTKEDDGRYSLAVTSGGNDESGNFGFAYLIERDSFLDLSMEGGLEGINVRDSDSYGDDEFSEDLNSMRTALEGFVENAASDTFPYGSSVEYTNSDQTAPTNLAYAILSIEDEDRYKEAAALGYGKLIRESKSHSLGFDSDPSTRVHEEYLKNIAESDGFQEFWENAIQPSLNIRDNFGTLDHGNISLARVSALLDAKENDNQGLMMFGSLGVGGRNSEVHAENIGKTPNIYIDSPDI